MFKNLNSSTCLGLGSKGLGERAEPFMLLQLCIEQSWFPDISTACCVYWHGGHYYNIQFLGSRFQSWGEVHSSPYKKRLSYSQVKQIKFRWCSLHISLNFQPLQSCSLEKPKTFYNGKVLCIHGDGLQWSQSDDSFLANMPQISVHFCVSQVHRLVLLLDSELVSASCYQ